MDHKARALDFLTAARQGNRAAAETLVTDHARHHNPHFAAGMSALLDAMVAAAQAMPDREMQVQRIIAEGDYVVVHSRVRHRPGEPGVAVVHLFRFEGERIAELWDVGQPVPAEMKNADGMF